MWTRQSSLVPGRYLTCSTPFGDGAMWTHHNPPGDSSQLVLNAFWRRGDVDHIQIPPGATEVVIVLNAFWRRGDVDTWPGAILV